MLGLYIYSSLLIALVIIGGLVPICILLDGAIRKVYSWFFPSVSILMIAILTVATVTHLLADVRTEADNIRTERENKNEP